MLQSYMYDRRSKLKKNVKSQIFISIISKLFSVYYLVRKQVPPFHVLHKTTLPENMKKSCRNIEIKDKMVCVQNVGRKIFVYNF